MSILQANVGVVEHKNTGADAGGGVVMPASEQWPRGHEQCLPTRVRVPVDTNSDGAVDHVASLNVRLVDWNGNGRFDRDSDGVLLDPCQLERIDPAVRMTFAPEHWRGAIKRAAAGL
jgi:hypothetical protein